MGTPFSCQCKERDKPIAERNWRVLHRNCHYSAFSGYHRTWSQWSTVICLTCNRSGRTKANYVPLLKDVDNAT